MEQHEEESSKNCEDSVPEVPASFDWSSETFDNYGVHEKRMHGPYKYIRDRLDFEHHGCYDLERQKFQDTRVRGLGDSIPRLNMFEALYKLLLLCLQRPWQLVLTLSLRLQDTIIAHIVGSGPREPHPWIIFTAGSFFAGKSWVASWLLEQGHLPLQVVRTDPDLIRTQLPEWTGYLKRDSSQAAVMTQREAGTCGLIAQWEAMRQGRHILVDGSLRILGTAKLSCIREKQLGQCFNSYFICEHCVCPCSVGVEAC